MKIFKIKFIKTKILKDIKNAQNIKTFIFKNIKNKIIISNH